MEEQPTRPAPRSDESEDERLDRELLELLNEVRVAMPGVQVLFGPLRGARRRSSPACSSWRWR